MRPRLRPRKAGKGKLKHVWFWLLYDEQDEVVFTFSTSSARHHIEQVLTEQFSGSLINYGYSSYASYAKKNTEVTHV